MSRAPGSYAGLTVMQADLLSYLRHEAAEDRTPSFEEMKAAMGMSSKSGVARLVDALIERRYVERGPGKARSLIVFDHQQPAALTLERATLPQILEELATRGLRMSVG
jgi:repressor LexA